MTPQITTSVLFAVCALLILFSGVRLSRYGDIIAEKTGLGGTWTGLILLATVTSLPELITGLSSMVVFDVPDIAAGDAIGSCMFNLAILAFLDFRHREPLSARVHQGHVLSAGFGIVQLGVAALAVIAGPRAPSVGWVGLHSLLFLSIYVISARTIFAYERTRMAEVAETLAGDVRYKDWRLSRAVLLYTINAAVLVAAASVLPGLAEQLATLTGLERSFIGSLMVATATSLPEVVVSVTAARIGAFDMAVANLFGSNLFNIAVIGVDDLVYLKGSMLTLVSRTHLVSLLASITMTAVAIIGLTYRARYKRYRLSWESIAILAIYGAGILLLALIH